MGAGGWRELCTGTTSQWSGVPWCCGTAARGWGGQRRNCGFGYIYEKLEFQNFPHSSFEVRVGGTAKKLLSSSPPPLSLLLSPLSFSSPLPLPPSPSFPFSRFGKVFISWTIMPSAVAYTLNRAPVGQGPSGPDWLGTGHCPWVLVWTGACCWKGVGGFMFLIIIHHHHVGVAPFCMRVFAFNIIMLPSFVFIHIEPFARHDDMKK